MPSARRAIRASAYFLLFCCVSIAIAACSGVKGAPPQVTLPMVSPLPSPQMPSWIIQTSPHGETATLAQIRIIFRDPLIPLQSIESAAEQTMLANFVVDPALPGRFRFLTPRMVGFQQDKALPLATRVRVLLKAGLRDLAGHELTHDLAWTFTTKPIEITNLPGTDEEGVREQPESTATDLKPTLRFRSNVELDLTSLRDHTALAPESGGPAVAVTINQDISNTPAPSDEDQPQYQYDASTRDWLYTVVPQSSLPKATSYVLSIRPGLRAAVGNLPSNRGFKGYIQTYGPLAFTGLQYVPNQPDRFVNGLPQLAFNNPLKADSVPKNLSIEPKPKSLSGLWQIEDGDSNVRINTAWLLPSTRYTITIGAGITDTFGQTLGKTRSVVYNTGDFAANFWAPDGENIFPADNNLQLNISAVNVPSKDYQETYRIIQPEELVWVDYPGSSTDHSGLLSDAVWHRTPLPAKKNEVVEIPVAIRKKLGGATGLLAYGVSAQTYRYENEPTQEYDGMIELTNLGVFAQLFPASGTVQVQHLSDGSPAINARIQLFVSHGAASNHGVALPCTAGRTDITGTFWVDADAVRRCSAEVTSQSYSDVPNLLVVAREGNDWAYAELGDWSGAYGYGVDAGWEGNKPVSRGTIFTDRQLYQPGETVSLVGEAYFLWNGALARDTNEHYHLILEGPSGARTSLGTKVSNAYGTFSIQVPLKANEPLGYHTVHAKADNGVELTGTFRVAEFKPPNFKVALQLDKKVAYPNDTVLGTGSSQYLFGSPLQGAAVNFYVTRELTQFSPNGWDEFSFGRQWFWPENPPSVPSDVVQTKKTLDASGDSAQKVQVAADLPFPMTYRMDMQVTDVSNLSVADSQTFTALPGNELIGLQSDWIATAGKPLTVKVIVTDPDGRALNRKRVVLHLDRSQYSSAAQLVEGGETEIDQVRYETVASTQVQSSSQPVDATLTPPRAGFYRIRANMNGAGSDATASDFGIWVTGPGEIDWGNQNRDHLQVRLDKAGYRIGDTATALIQSPYPQADLYFAVVREKTLFHVTQRVRGGAPEIHFTVTRDMLPNAAVEAVLVRRGQPLQHVAPGSLDSLDRIGFAPFSVNLDDRYLNLSIVPARMTMEPGSHQTVQLHLSDKSGHALSGQCSVVVANEAILQLTGYRIPDLVKIVYANQQISTRFADNRPQVVLQQIASPLQKGWGYGGGFLAGPGATRIRQNFKPLAYFNAEVPVDRNGNAKVSFQAPDDLTTWRIMAVATEPSGGGRPGFRFANADATFVTQKPLLTNAILPQFARPGDQLQGGLTVTNPGGLSGELAISGSLSGPLSFENKSGNSATQSFAGSVQTGTQAYRFPMLVTGQGTAYLTFTSSVDGHSDAFRVPLEIRPPQSVMEQAIESGVTANTVSIPLNVSSNVVNDSGGLDVTLASSLLPEITVPAMRTLNDNDLLILEPIASRLSIAADLKVLSERYGRSLDNFNATQFARTTLAQLLKLQLADGGFEWFAGLSRSNPFITPYAAEALADAQRAGVSVGPVVLKSVKRYLESELSDEFCSGFEPCTSRTRLDILAALSALGTPRNDYLSDIYDQRDKFDLLGRVKLARLLLQFPAWRTQADSMAASVKQNVYETGRYATINYPEEWGWLASPAAMRAQVLRLFIARKSDPELLDKLAASLLALRRDGAWSDTYDTAEALGALVQYANLQPTPPNFAATARLGGTMIQSVTFKGYHVTSAQAHVAQAALPRGTHALVVSKSGSGSLHYMAAYSYRLPGNQPGILNGVRVTREVRPANKDNVLAKMGFNAPNDPLTVLPGQVFDVAVEIITDHPIDHVLITDELPAGMEAVDTAFRTSTPYFEAKDDSWEIDYQTIHKDRIVAYATRLEAGVYSMHYLVRSVTPGTYLWPPAEAHLQYAPEEFGRSASSTLIISNG